ncbi:MAG: recombinase family protein [Eubacteriales bacterium]|nr:recombinase family protein [Eubacteriales bacterium]
MNNKEKADRNAGIRVAAYIRVSTENENQKDSYELQEQYFLRLLSENESWVFAGIYSDYGISATNDRKRNGFQRLLRHCREGKIDRVVCKSISRFARNTGDFITALQTLKESNVTILFEKENIDTAEPVSDFIMTTLGAIAQEESRNISENVSWGFRKRYANGDARNFTIYGYRYAEGENAVAVTGTGFQLRRVEIVEEEAEIVRRIFREAAEGKSYTEIARQLNLEHIAAPEAIWTPKHKRKREGTAPKKGELKEGIDQGWTADYIRHMLKLERYTGDLMLQKKYTADYLTHSVHRNHGERPQFYVKNHHPAIISRELYQEAQKNSPASGAVGTPGRVRYPFSGRLVCGQCGRFYHTRNRQSHPIWFCPSSVLNNGKKVCQATRVYEEQIILMFRKAVVERFKLAELCEPAWVQEAVLPAGAAGCDFVSQMCERLEDHQNSDCMERDCAFLKKQILAASTSRAGLEKKRMELDAKGYLTTERRGVLNEKLENAREEERNFTERLKHLETYREELEADFAWRAKAIEWMRHLPPGQKGIAGFLEGITAEYMKAFVLSITIDSPKKYRIHWFDDVWTEVEMDSEIEDHRETAWCVGGFGMR